MAYAAANWSLAPNDRSLVVPHDQNVILDPLHPRTSEVPEVRQERVSLDPRLRPFRLEAAS